MLAGKSGVAIFPAREALPKELEKLIRFGGWNGNSRISETWSFQNNKWSKLNIDNGPAPRNHCDMVYDERNKKIILFGGHDGDNVFGDTWEFTNNKWKKISESKSIKRIKNGH